MAIEVFGPRVRRIELVGRHLLVLGHDGIDAARDRIGFHILRPVHGRGTQRIGGKARLEQHLGLRGKALVRREWAGAINQRQPVHRAIGIELGHRQHAVIENVFAAAGLAGSKVALETKR